MVGISPAIQRQMIHPNEPAFTLQRQGPFVFLSGFIWHSFMILSAVHVIAKADTMTTAKVQPHVHQ